VRIARARITPFALPLRTPLTTAHETLFERCGWLLALESADGHLGWGDASPIRGFGMEDHKTCGEALAWGVRALLGREPGELGRLLEAAENALPEAPGARAAMDSALHDLLAREQDRSVASLLAEARGDDPRPSLEVGYLCGGADPADATRLHLAFHASHEPSRGPLSTCMHRDDASTVSFSWIDVDRHGVRFHHVPNPPCRGLPSGPPIVLDRRRPG